MCNVYIRSAVTLNLPVHCVCVLCVLWKVILFHFFFYFSTEMRAKVHSHLKVQQKMVCADVVWVLQTYSFFARQGSFIYTASFILKGRMKIVCIQIRQNDTIQS